MKELEKQIGEFHTDRINVAIPPDKKEALLKKLGGGLENIGPFKVEKFITTDGYKFLLPNGEWVAFRASGTEPLIRCYIEAKSAALDLIKPGDRICIVFTDITRATPNERIIPWLLEHLGSVPRENITLLNGLGTHRPNSPR